MAENHNIIRLSNSNTLRFLVKCFLSRVAGIRVFAELGLHARAPPNSTWGKTPLR